MGYAGNSQALFLRKSILAFLESSSGHKTLIAYYVALSELGEEDILNYLRTILPDYMIPARLVYLEKLPFNLNGKIDRKALPDPVLLSKDSYVAPETHLKLRSAKFGGGFGFS